MNIAQLVQTCVTCLRSKSPHLPQCGPLCSIVTPRPFELVCMDFMSLEKSKGGYGNILVITDLFAKYALSIPTKKQEAKTVLTFSSLN